MKPRWFGVLRAVTPVSIRLAIGLLAALLAVAGLVRYKHGAHAETIHESASLSVPTVAVVKVGRKDLYKEVTIPAEFRPYLEVELQAKVSGYLKLLTVDIGDRVKAGELLATLEVPELKDDLDHAIAAQQRAEADYHDAHLVYTRLQAVNKTHPNLVAQQDLDTAEAKDLTTAAAIAAAKADVEKYQTMLAYTRITAPFDGVITRRYTDPGELIQTGASSDVQAMPLVRLSDNYRLRLDFPVTVDYVKDIQIGDPVDVRVESLGGKLFTGVIARFTRNVDDKTRTMITELEIPNPKLELVPGMYATAILKVERRSEVLAIPNEAIAATKGMQVYVVNGDHTVEARQVTLGLETPDMYEVTSGLKEGELVVVGGRANIRPGQKVEIKMTGTPG